MSGKRKADYDAKTEEEELEKLIDKGRKWLKVDAGFDSNYILKGFDLTKLYGFDPKTLFGAIKKIQCAGTGRYCL